MNIMYLSFVSDCDPKMVGVLKKINGQVNVFKKKFKKCYYTSLGSEGLNIWNASNDEKVEKINFTKFPIEKIAKRKSFFLDLVNFNTKNKIDVIYFRYRLSGADPYLLSFLKKCKRNNIKVFLEIATYPYDKEMTKINYVIDKFCSKFLHKYVDSIVTFSNHKKIFGIETININNGVEVESIKLSKTRYNGSVLNLIGVANVSKWHGYDRVIEGLKDYYRKGKEDKLKVTFTIIGEGNEIPRLKEMVNNYNLQSYVYFKGFMNGKDLDCEFDKAHIGIVSLGIHRLGLKSVSTLKSKEYWARGLPFVKSYKDLQVDNIIGEFVLNVEANEGKVKIEKIINFFTGILESKSDFKAEMRCLAEQNITWNIQLEPVIKKMLN